ncbi:extracellular solute-binding protein [Streptomyces avicenniae]|uniref:extracellular solute-binding protein n=1 Tax=Streptomyces avicenniae TaxID=500153 RepID=UPI000DA62E2F|nr:extracellular solute-binding protein [Streptomyces avicenniae]
MSTVRGRWVGRALAPVTALVVTAGLTACGGGEGGSGGGGGALQVWVRGAEDSAAAYEEIFAGYTERTGVEVELFMTLTDFETKLNAAAAARDLPDVVINDAAQLGTMLGQGIITEIDRDALAGQEDVSDTAWASTTDIAGATYAVPFSAQANVLLVRTDWLDAVGMEAPTTWDELLAVGRAFTTEDPDGNGQDDTYGMAVPGSTERGYLAWNWATYLAQAGGSFLEPVPGGDGAYVSGAGSDAAVASADLLTRMICGDAPMAQPGALNHVTSATNTAFQTGVTGMYLTGPYAYATTDATEIEGLYTAVAPPAGPAGAGSLAEGTSLYAMAGSDHADAFPGFAEYMISAEAQETGMIGVGSATVVRLPVNTTVDVAEVRAGDERWELARRVYEENGVYEPVAVPNWGAYRAAAAETLNSLAADCGDTAAAMAELDATFTGMLGDAGIGG